MGMRNSTTQPPLGRPLNISHPLSQGLIGYWPMNEGGGQISQDIISANNGILTNGAVYTQSVKGNCIQFDGTNDYLNLSKNNLAPGSRWSYSAQVRFIASTGGTQYIYWDGIDNAGNNPHVAVGLTNAVPAFYSAMRDANSITISSNTVALSYNTWYALTVTFDRIALKLTQFINGVLVATGTQSSLSSIDTNSASVPVMGTGKSQGTPGAYLNGNLSNVMIWSRCLSATEVMQLYVNPYSMFQNVRPLKLAV